MHIKDIFGKEFIISFEFFPPKTVESEKELFKNIEKLKLMNPDFVSVTYGAGGSTREKTRELSINIKRKYHLNVMSHLTCVGHTKEDLKDILMVYKENGIDNILALRGDPPTEIDKTYLKSDFTYAYEMIDFIRKEFGDYFSIGGAAFPELHQDSPNIESELKYFKNKMSHGMDFAITQLFFVNQFYFDFVKKAKEIGINTPIIPGIMPITNFKQIKKFASLCNAKIPDDLIQKLEKYENDNEEVAKIGIDYAVKQCEELIKFGVPGLHFYTLNKSDATMKIFDRLSVLDI